MNSLLTWISVYEKLVSTTLRYTPVVLDHHVPYKTLADGRLWVSRRSLQFSLLNNLNFSKAPTQTPKLKALQKLIQSYFYNILHLIEGLSDENTLLLAVNESSKIVPYIISSRKAVKTYIKVCEICPWSCIAKFSIAPRLVWSYGPQQPTMFV